MRMLISLACFFGFHDWRIDEEVEVEATDTDHPVLFRSGGVDYHCGCAWCPATKVESRRGVWLPLGYPAR